MLGPMKGAMLKTAMGSCSSCLANRSPVVPPDTVRKALPASPSKKRATMMVATPRATAAGTSQMTYMVHDTR